MPCSHHQGHILQSKFTGGGAVATDQADNFYRESVLEKFPRLTVQVVVTGVQSDCSFRDKAALICPTAHMLPESTAAVSWG